MTAFPRTGRVATVPFVGSAEAFVLGAPRSAGVPMQRIRPAVAKLSAEIGLDHALASRQVYTDGAEPILDYATQSDDEAMLTVVRTGAALRRDHPRLSQAHHLRRRRVGRAVASAHIRQG